ncbi:MAG: ribosome small subunit-dependent GTPase A [Acidobacteriota bacterium]|nr:ribosome small subunit-dependent GTPase A [Acidobacteriota bacterium]
MPRKERSLTKHIQEHANRLAEKEIVKNKEKLRKLPRARIDAEGGDEFQERPLRAFKPASPRMETAEAKIELTQGQVIATGPGTCKVLAGNDIVVCRAQVPVVAGDRVSFNEGRQIRWVLPRSSVLSRPDPGNANVEKVIAANIDVVVIVVSVRAPALRPGLVDRYLIAIEKGCAAPVLCVNKSDLIESAADLEPLEPYVNLGFPIIRCSVKTGDGIETLRETLAGKLCVFAGHSGVGKSSLLNALEPEIRAVTGEISAVHQKGQHTTTASTLYQLPNGARIIDTPGIREFGLWDLEKADLSGYFHEFDEFSPQCNYADCSHTHEPACAVRDAVQRGVIADARYQAYKRLLEGLA